MANEFPAAPRAVQLPLDPANDTLELAHELLAAFRAHSYVPAAAFIQRTIGFLILQHL